MDPRQILAENTPHSGSFCDGSFVDSLHETGRWDVDEYWKVEWALYALSSDRSDVHYTRDADDARAFRIFSYTISTFAFHFDSSDGFKITNLSNDEIGAWRERLQLVFEGCFSGSLPDQSIFERVNPLLAKSDSAS